MEIILCAETDAARWEQFVSSHPDATSYHRWNWKYIFENVFGWNTYYLLAQNDGATHGILPLVWQKSLRGSYLSSMPHLKGGGVVAAGRAVEEQLIVRATDIAREVKAEYLELRHLNDHQLNLATRDDKIGAVLEIESDAGARLSRLDKKTRNLVRKSQTFGMAAEFGSAELLEDFYRVYCHNMRDLGSPTYSRDFFAEILTRFPADTHLCAVRREGEVVAAAFLIGFRETVEAAWASSYRKYRELKPNMFLYWELLSFAARRGYRWFDFGRSSVGSGTYEFKLQWGAQPTPLHWDYWLANGKPMPGTRGSNMQLASRIWRHLPVAITNNLGPRLIKLIPGI